MEGMPPSKAVIRILSMTTEQLDILMVEDDREQSSMIVDTARVCQSTIRWEIVEDGEKALDFLRRQGAYASRPKPSLVLLDLHLPKLNGVDVLRTIKSEHSLRGLPVIIMSSSREQADIEAAYALGANCYIAKPGSYEGLCSLVKFLEAFLTLPKLPTPTSPPVARSGSSTVNNLN